MAFIEPIPMVGIGMALPELVPLCYSTFVSKMILRLLVCWFYVRVQYSGLDSANMAIKWGDVGYLGIGGWGIVTRSGE